MKSIIKKLQNSKRKKKLLNSSLLMLRPVHLKNLGLILINATFQATTKIS
jgi:hypothetical protein